ncbi:MAG: pseudouridylate synthase [Deltaproteobacteria bacterium]|nr:pseudouridylate synthase [Deltaproteobacteria bacterium]
MERGVTGGQHARAHSVNVLYRDDRLLALDKPPGIIVHRGLADDDDTMADRARDLVGRPVHALHRLDRGTSGVLMFALDAETARVLQSAFTRTYLALVRGIPAPLSGRIDHPIPKGEGKDRVAAVSDYRVLGVCSARYGWVEVTPLTGRFHQVRRHMKHIDCPLIGDTTYGKSEHNRLWRERYGLSRLALHARAVTLDYNGAALAIEAPVPDDLTRALAAAGLSDPTR